MPRSHPSQRLPGILLATLFAICAPGCIVVSTVKAAGNLTAATVKTTGTIATAAIKTTGGIVSTAVSTGAGVADAGLRTAISLSKAGAIVVFNSQTGALMEMPWTNGILVSAAMNAAKMGLEAQSSRIVRKGTEVLVPKDRWTRTYLEDGDVLVVEDPKR